LSDVEVLALYRLVAEAMIARYPDIRIGVEPADGGSTIRVLLIDEDGRETQRAHARVAAMAEDPLAVVETDFRRWLTEFGYHAAETALAVAP
jgi:hypothetical protein